MANFKQYPGKGEWDGANNCLNITNGDASALILWGGGPDGKPLVLGAANLNLISPIQEKAGPGASERTFLFSARAPGTVTFFAKVGSIGGPDYVAPFTVVIVPKKPSSIGPEHIVLFAGKGSDEDDVAIEGNKKAVKVGGSAYRIKSRQQLHELLTKYRDGGRKIAYLEFNTHGAPGFASFGGGEGLSTAGLAYYRGQGFQSVFAPNARVFFHGCNIADGDEGEEFLKEFGRIFLVGGGGTVAGSTSLGFGTGALGGSGVYHFWGDVVRVYISNHGSVEKVEKNGRSGPDLPPSLRPPQP